MKYKIINFQIWLPICFVSSGGKVLIKRHEYLKSILREFTKKSQGSVLSADVRLAGSENVVCGQPTNSF